MIIFKKGDRVWADFGKLIPDVTGTNIWYPNIMKGKIIDIKIEPIYHDSECLVKNKIGKERWITVTRIFPR